jgi:cysteine desulfurase
MYGPKGVGALYVRRQKPRVRLVSQMDGGGHERGMRSGTINVPSIVGFGKAAEIANKEWRDDAKRIFGMRQRLREKLFAALDTIHLNGADDPRRLPGNLNVSFSFVEGEAMMMAIRRFVSASASSTRTKRSTTWPSW